MKRIIMILAVLLIAASASSQELVILHVNDTHSHLDPLRSGDRCGKGGAIERASYVDSVRAADGRRNVLLLHAGDFSQGTSYFSVLKGDLEISVINAMKYDVITLGNHEFDNGLDELARRLRTLRCPVVCANYDFSASPVGRYVRPYAIVRRGGMKIGIFGMLTDISKVVDGSIAADIRKLDDVETANRWISYLKDEKGCDIVIALSHLGFDGSDFTDKELVRSTRGLDLVIGGHSHTEMEAPALIADAGGRQVPVIQDGCWGLFVGRMEVKKCD